MKTLTDEIKTILLQHLPDAHIEVSDPMQDGAHLEAIVVSDSFKGQSLLKQQRTVLNFLKTSFETNLHALKLKTYTFETWNQIKES